jgi:hypothetical protein
MVDLSERMLVLCMSFLHYIYLIYPQGYEHEFGTMFILLLLKIYDFPMDKAPFKKHSLLFYVIFQIC